MSATEERIDELIKGSQYSLLQADKERQLLSILRGQCQQMAAHSVPYGLFLQRLGKPTEQWETLMDIPPLPVSMFKRFRLTTVPDDKIIRELTSSATTGQQPSRIFIDKVTGFRQTRALVSILKEHLGGKRRPVLVIDSIEAAGTQDNLSARGAGIRGVANYASEIVYALEKTADGGLEPRWDVIENFFAKMEAPTQQVLLFGFTFMVWTTFLEQARKRGLKFNAPNAILLHSGGWKKLQNQAVSKEEFSRTAGEVLGCDPTHVLDFYGMAEQLGTVFVDCAAGHKHAPAFADVILRRSHTLDHVAIGEEGIIEVVSVLPNSYPGQALITEDRGILLGIDDCTCGAKGKYFRFTRRVERVELRGCGDTFAQSREI